ncbi:hypothetical protein GCM10009665_42590 [Kitasatospora nipponensis]|uniref:YcxB-like C-terminal domain-containing protein n=1 Tax=Kitasatospora nipponensis TaxID=258049 RepID=A0ABN1WGQ4_9ACTN
MDIESTFRLTEREMRRAMRNSPALRGMLIIGCLLTVVALLSPFVDRHPQYWLLAVGPGILAFLEIVAVRMASRRGTELFTEPWAVRITEQGFHLRTPKSSAEVSWSAYREVTERAGFWYLHQTNRTLALLPQHAFDDSQRAELAAFFGTRLPPLKRPWYRPFG